MVRQTKAWRKKKVAEGFRLNTIMNKNRFYIKVQDQNLYDGYKVTDLPKMYIEENGLFKCNICKTQNDKEGSFKTVDKTKKKLRTLLIHLFKHCDLHIGEAISKIPGAGKNLNTNIAEIGNKNYTFK